MAADIRLNKIRQLIAANDKQDAEKIQRITREIVAAEEHLFFSEDMPELYHAQQDVDLALSKDVAQARREAPVTYHAGYMEGYNDAVRAILRKSTSDRNVLELVRDEPRQKDLLLFLYNRWDNKGATKSDIQTRMNIEEYEVQELVDDAYEAGAVTVTTPTADSVCFFLTKAGSLFCRKLVAIVGEDEEDISDDDVLAFRRQMVAELYKLDMPERELPPVEDIEIRDAIRNGKSPEAFAQEILE